MDVRRVPVQLDPQDMDFCHSAARSRGKRPTRFGGRRTKRLFLLSRPTPRKKRKDHDVSIVRTVLLASTETTEQMTELSRMVREIAGITRTDLDTKSRTLTMRAFPLQAIMVATGIIEDLERPPDELILEPRSDGSGPATTIWI